VNWITAGTNQGARTTNTNVKCDRFREAASARLDGEPIGMAVSALDHHLATCVDCAGWIEDATRLSRTVRVSSTAVPDLSEQILADTVLPTRRVLRWRNQLRVSIALVGLVQLGLATPSLFGTDIGMAMSEHATHEAAAWSAALGIALLATAFKPARASGVLAVLATFVGVLALLSIRDVASGAVELPRLATHLAAVAGLGLVALLSRAERALPPAPEVAAGTSRSRLRGVA
jgi:predicted anti-sigma-YlaC factor YlaD